MKNLLLILLAVMILSVGCVGLEVTETQEIALHKLARIAGITFGLENSEDVDKALSYLEYLNTLENGKLKDAAINVAVKWAYKKYGKTSKTVILVAEVVDIVKYVVPDEAGANFDTRLLDIAVGGITEGLLLTK